MDMENRMASSSSPFADIPTYDRKSGNVNVIVTTPQGGRNHYTCDPATGIFRMTGVLPESRFPFSLGIVAGTANADGTPVQVLLLADEASFPGCVLQARLLGAISTTESGEFTGAILGKRLAESVSASGDDPAPYYRIVAACAMSHTWHTAKTFKDLDDTTLDAIEQFFVTYGNFTGVPFTPVKRHLPANAIALVSSGRVRFKKLPISFRFRRPGGPQGGKKGS